MKLTIVSLLFVICPALLFAQQDSTATKVEAPVDSVVERLVEMAYLNPRVRTIENVTTQAEWEYKRGKTAYLNNITVAGNVNEVSLKQSGNVNVDPLRQSTQYPRYNIGVVIPVGLFINNGKTNKANYYRHQSLLDQVQIEKNSIKREVTLLYQSYVLNKQLLALQQEVLQDAKVLLAKHEDDFKNDKITIEAYINTNRMYNGEQEKEVNINGRTRTIAAELEALIGMNLDVALEMINNQIRSTTR